MAWAEPTPEVGWLPALGWLFGAYALGGLTTGYYLVRARTGQDIREVGSGSVGARNVSRVLGSTGFCLTLLGDAAKGAVVVGLVRYFTGDALLAAAAVLAVVAGHIWPVNLRGRGGKGAATALGAVLMFDWQVALTCLASAIPAVIVLRKATLPGMVSFLVLPLVSYWLNRSFAEAALLAGLSAMILFTHRQNIAERIAALSARRELSVKPQPPKL